MHTNKDQSAPPKPKCGIIMPISGSVDYTAEHWQDVLQVIQDAADSAGFDATLVSDKGRADVIQSTIIDNIFHNDIVICDVSSMNPNVMLELGLRFASKKPVIIIFDADARYPFDIHQMRYYEYGKTLRYSDMVRFRTRLTELISSVHRDAQEGRYKPYLSYFTDVQIDAASIPVEQVGLSDVVESLVSSVKRLEERLDQRTNGIYLNNRKINYSHKPLDSISTPQGFEGLSFVITPSSVHRLLLEYPFDSLNKFDTIKSIGINLINKYPNIIKTVSEDQLYQYITEIAVQVMGKEAWESL